MNIVNEKKNRVKSIYDNNNGTFSIVGGDGFSTKLYNSFEYAHAAIENDGEENPHDKVVRILKGDFEKKFGMSFDEFNKIYNEILKTCPEKLI